MPRNPAPKLDEMADLTAEECRVLDCMDGELGRPFAYLAELAEVPEKEVRLIVRRFHAAGLTMFGWLVSEDDGLLRGKGYWLNRRGFDMRTALRKSKEPDNAVA